MTTFLAWLVGLMIGFVAGVWTTWSIVLPSLIGAIKSVLKPVDRTSPPDASGGTSEP